MLIPIEKLIYGGDGLARGPDKTIFVPFVLEGEQVVAEVTEQRPGFARAQATRIVSASEHRIEARCPYFQRCGGCHYQHTSYQHQLEIKASILRETLRRTGKLEWTSEIATHPSPPWEYRNRTRMRIMREPEFSLAYFRFASHEPLAIAECPISSPLINRTIAAVNALGKSGAVPEGIAEIELFADSADLQLMLELYCNPVPAQARLEELLAVLRSSISQIASLAAFRLLDRQHSPSSAGERPPLVLGAPFVTYRTQTSEYRVSPGSFFQTNRHLTQTLIELATKDRSGRLALDLYAGVGLFTSALAPNFERVIAVESATSSARDLRHNVPPNAHPVAQDVEAFLISREAQRLRPDLVIVDPPRAGLGERVARQLASLAASRITYVSCDPATLARDLRVLLASGYAIEQIDLVDLFPQTFHIESVAYLTRHG